MGKKYIEYCQSSKVYVCKRCRCHLSNFEELVSKDFWAGQGKAFLYNRVLNFKTGQITQRNFRTGLHRVRDVFCAHCEVKIGWKYEWALQPEQKYKEGKFILERSLIDKDEWDSP